MGTFCFCRSRKLQRLPSNLEARKADRADDKTGEARFSGDI